MSAFLETFLKPLNTDPKIDETEIQPLFPKIQELLTMAQLKQRSEKQEIKNDTESFESNFLLKTQKIEEILKKEETEQKNFAREILEENKDNPKFLHKLIRFLFDKKHILLLEIMLILASELAQIECIKLILNENIENFLILNVNACDSESGKTALHRCVENSTIQHWAIARLLLCAGANMEILDKKRLSPFGIILAKKENGIENSNYFHALFYEFHKSRKDFPRRNDTEYELKNKKDSKKMVKIKTQYIRPFFKFIEKNNSDTLNDIIKILNRLLKSKPDFSSLSGKEEGEFRCYMATLLVDFTTALVSINRYYDAILKGMEEAFTNAHPRKHYRNRLFRLKLECVIYNREVTNLLDLMREKIYDYFELNIPHSVDSLKRNYSAIIFDLKRKVLKSCKTKLGLLGRCLSQLLDKKDRSVYDSRLFLSFLEEYFPGDIRSLSFTFEWVNKQQKQTEALLAASQNIPTVDVIQALKPCVKKQVSQIGCTFQRKMLISNKQITFDDLECYIIFLKTLFLAIFNDQSEVLLGTYPIHLVGDLLISYVFEQELQNKKDEKDLILNCPTLTNFSPAEFLKTRRNSNDEDPLGKDSSLDFPDFYVSLKEEDAKRKQEFSEEEEKALREKEYELEQEKRQQRKKTEEKRKLEEKILFEKKQEEKAKNETNNLIVGKLFKTLYPEDKNKETIELLRNILSGEIKSISKKSFLTTVKTLEINGFENIQSDNVTVQGNKIKLVLTKDASVTIHFRHGRDRDDEIDPAGIKEFKEMFEKVDLNHNNFDTKMKLYFDKFASIAKALEKVKTQKVLVLSSNGKKTVEQQALLPKVQENKDKQKPKKE